MIPKIVYGTSNTTIEFNKVLSGFDLEEKIITNSTNNVTHSGNTQTVFNFNEFQKTLKFSHIEESHYQLMLTFMTTHALHGKSFDFYPDKTSSTFVTYTLQTSKRARQFKPKVISPNPKLYKFDIYVRRV